MTGRPLPWYFVRVPLSHLLLVTQTQGLSSVTRQNQGLLDVRWLCSPTSSATIISLLSHCLGAVNKVHSSYQSVSNVRKWKHGYSRLGHHPRKNWLNLLYFVSLNDAAAVKR